MPRVFAAIAFSALIVGCGSLINELERIKNKATAVAPTNSPTAPTVLYTIPADGTVSAPAQAYIDIVYDQPLDASTVTSPSTNGACTGSVGASFDAFVSCGGTASVNGNTIRLSANSTMPRGAAIKVQTSAAIKGANGAAATAYQSTTGFSFVTPCGQDCFYSDSAPMTSATSAGSHSFVIPSGVKAGWILTYTGASGNTTFYDPATNQTSTGPTATCGINTGSHSFVVTTPGGARSGHVITVCGGASGLTTDFDPAANTFSGGPGIVGGSPAAGAMTIPILTGGSGGRFATIVGGGGTVTSVFDPIANSYTLGNPLFNSAAAGATWIRQDDGLPFILNASGGTATNLLTETTMIYSNPYTTAGPFGNGALMFRVNAGALVGRIFMANGGGTTNSIGYNQAGGAIGGPTIPFSIDTGAQAATLSSGPRSGETLIIGGGISGTANYAFYNHSSNSYSSLTTLTGVVGSNSSLTKISSGPHAGKYFLVNGNVTVNTSVFDPAQDSFVGTRLFKTTGAGIDGFAIKSGTKAGRVMLMTGGNMSTSLYNPQTGLMEMGPDTAGPISAGTVNFPITNGTHAGKQFAFFGSGAALQKYDPVGNSFSIATAGPDFTTAPSAKGAGSRVVLIGNSGPQANNYLLLNGGGTASADFFNTTTNTFTTGIGITGCGSVNAGSWIFYVSSGSHAGKLQIICGTIATTSLFNISSASFAAGPALGVSPAAGTHGFYIDTGSNAGKYLLVLASGIATRVYDPAGPSWAVGPTLCGVAGGGGFSIPVAAGVHAGKTLVALGGGLTTTCVYDPATNLFVAGPATGSHTGYSVGANGLAFPTGGGLYPTAYVVINGGGSTAFGHFFGY